MFRKIINLLIFIRNNINKDINVAYFTIVFILITIISLSLKF